MGESKEKEIVILNLVLLALAGISLFVAVWTVVSNWFKAGTDDLFMVLTCLMLALLFALNPMIWAYEKGWLRNPLKRSANAESEEKAEKEEKAAAR